MKRPFISPFLTNQPQAGRWGYLQRCQFDIGVKFCQSNSRSTFESDVNFRNEFPNGNQLVTRN